MNPLAQITVRNGRLLADGQEYDCRLGRGGIKADKREGDLATPAGSFPMRWCYYRADKLIAPQTLLPLMEITANDGWCDDPAHALYNQPVTLPFEGRHEKLWREDDVYDLVIPLGYNDDPVKAGKGSAIFLHLMRADGVGTEGCVALKREDLLTLLPRFSAQTLVVVEG
jgi:L,D-peptidoglycan transpeptidase YkuD (ErfK/YbiS/YcfS/YnhG family)